MTNATTTCAYSHTQRNVLLDEFLTPIELIEQCFVDAIVPQFKADAPIRILDVGANDGHWGKIARQYFPNAHLVGIEIMNMPVPNSYNEWYNADFITQGLFTNEFDLIIGNPPFTVKEPKEDGGYTTKYKAEDFVRKALSLLNDDGYLAFILRSNFRHSLERYWLNRERTQPGLFQTNCPFEVWDMILRPSYYKEDKRTKQYGTKATNAHDNALFVWWKQWKQTFYYGRHLDWNYKE